jgi:hypothetical protein
MRIINLDHCFIWGNTHYGTMVYLPPGKLTSLGKSTIWAIYTIAMLNYQRVITIHSPLAIKNLH